MFRTKKALLVLAAAATLFSSGCFGGNWWKWIEGATQWGFNFTGILDNFGILKG